MIRPKTILPALALCALSVRSADRLELSPHSIDLPGLPSTIVSTDLNGDGRTDLLVVSAFTEVETIGTQRIEDMVAVSTVIPAAFERRELQAFLADDGGFSPTPALPLETTVHSLEPGPPGWPAIAVTDEGIATLELTQEGLRFNLVLAGTPIVAGTKAFLPGLRCVRDLDGDGAKDDLLLPFEPLTVVIDPVAGGAPRPVHGAGADPLPGGGTGTYLPWPSTANVDGDSRPDLVLREWGATQARLRVFRGAGDGSFSSLRDEPADCHDRSELRYRALPENTEIPWPGDPFSVVDLDGDGQAELVRREWLERPGDGFLAGLKEVRRPRQKFLFHRLDEAGRVEPEPYSTLEVEGYLPENVALFDSETFVDLDGDGRRELTTSTLRFSSLQAVRILATKRLSVGIDFHVYRQNEEGDFAEVPGLDLEEKLKLNLNDIRLTRYAQFAGDFNGDGKREFVHFGRGREVTIHLGRDGCRYSDRPDVTIRLDREPNDLDLLRVDDFDGDGRSDLALIEPVESRDPDESPGSRITFYLSGGAR